MKGNILVAVVVAWIALALAPTCVIHAAEANPAGAAQQTASVHGRVKNVATGQYLNKARVSIRGTDQVAYTDEFGVYRFAGVRSGPIVLDVFYTDLDRQEISLNLPAGSSIEQDVELTSIARYGQDPKLVTLDPFLVASQKETDAEAIAINEQRFAPNLINVVATDAMGDLVGSDAGEFLKYLPGLTPEYAEGDIAGISVRGIPSEMTGVNFDGAPIVTGKNNGGTRLVDMRSLSLNNVSRIEVSKVPTPSSPADSLSGSVNMISKNAFERSGGELRYGLYLVGSGHELSLKKTPHAYGDKNTYKTQPGFDFDYTLPIGKNFGVVVTGMQSEKYTPQSRLINTWNSGGTATGASPDQPFFQQFALRGAPRSKRLTAFSVKADWRITPHSVLSVGARKSRNVAAMSGTQIVTVNAGVNANPAPASGVRFSYGPDFTSGATGRGQVTLTGNQQYSLFETLGTYLKYRFDDGKWRIESNVNYSDSETRLNPFTSKPGGDFQNVTAVMTNPVRIAFSGIGPDGPGSIQAFNNSNQEVDIYDIRNYRLSAASENRQKLLNTIKSGNLDLRRRLELFPFPSAIQIGGLHRVHTLDRHGNASGAWTPAANTNAEPYQFRTYVNRDIYKTWNFPGIYGGAVWDAFQADPTLFTQTNAQVVAAENARLDTSQYAEEAMTAYYLQGEMRLLASRLNVLTGVRFERTEVAGEGVLFDPSAVFVRNADGSFARNAQGARIRKPEAGAAGSLQEVALIRKERGYIAERSYDGFYPSLHLTYNIKENFLARLAYARTYGRPNFPDIIPSATIDETDLEEGEINDPNIIQGDITVTNPGLKPWTAHNFDFSAEYYTQSGGLFSGGVFLKEISDFFGNEVRVATAADLAEVGLDPRYVGWNLRTKFNSGDARISGVELNVRHSLRELGGWGRYFTVFANATRLKLEGDRQTDFGGFIPKTANWGFKFTWKRLTVMPKWNYRGLIQGNAQPGFAPDAYVYTKPITVLDLNVRYQLTRRLSLTVAVTNLFNAHRATRRYGSETPDYAREFQDFDYGALVSVGLKGTF